MDIEQQQDKTKQIKAVMFKEYLLFFIVLYFKLVCANSKHLDSQPRCRFQTISCSCKEWNRVPSELLNVTVQTCVFHENEETKSVCNGKAILTKCRKAFFSQKRQRRNTGSLDLHCKNGTILPPDSSPSIKSPPEVRINGNSHNVQADQDITFECTVTSNLAANVTWLFDGVPLPEQMGHRYSYRDCRKVLNIRDVMTKDAGNYTCIVQNEIGRAMASSSLSVNKKDKIPYIQYMGLEGKSGNNTAVIGSSLNLTCESQNIDTQNAFLKDGLQVKEGDGTHYTFYHMRNSERGTKIVNLEIKNVTFEDTGNYTCIAILDLIVKRKTFPLRIVNASRPCSPSDCPSEEDQQFQKTMDVHTTSLQTFGIIFGLIVAVVITLVVSICVARKLPWLLSCITRKTSSKQQEVLPSELTVAHSELNGLCVDTNNIQCSDVVKRPPERDFEAKYDVFICYSSKDISWVKELLAELEKRNFVCCIDYKDFRIGAAIVENISQAIYYSRKTVAVLTPDFVNSEWCSHELQKALTRIRSHQVVPIVYKNCAIPLMLQDRTYLDWENCHVKPYFWDQLEKALQLPSDSLICFDK